MSNFFIKNIQLLFIINEIVDFTDPTNIKFPKYIFKNQSYEKFEDIANNKFGYKLISFSRLDGNHIWAYILDKESNTWYNYNDMSSKIIKTSNDEIIRVFDRLEGAKGIYYCLELQDNTKPNTTILDLICDIINK